MPPFSGFFLPEIRQSLPLYCGLLPCFILNCDKIATFFEINKKDLHKKRVSL